MSHIIKNTDKQGDTQTRLCVHAIHKENNTLVCYYSVCGAIVNSQLAIKTCNALDHAISRKNQNSYEIMVKIYLKVKIKLMVLKGE